MQEQYSLSLQEALLLLATKELGPKEVRGVLSYYQTHAINTSEYEYLFTHEIADFMAEQYLSLIEMVDSCKKDVDSWGALHWALKRGKSERQTMQQYNDVIETLVKKSDARTILDCSYFVVERFLKEDSFFSPKLINTLVTCLSDKFAEFFVFIATQIQIRGVLAVGDEKMQRDSFLLIYKKFLSQIKYLDQADLVSCVTFIEELNKRNSFGPLAALKVLRGLRDKKGQSEVMNKVGAKWVLFTFTQLQGDKKYSKARHYFEIYKMYEDMQDVKQFQEWPVIQAKAQAYLIQQSIAGQPELAVEKHKSFKI